MVTGEEFLRDLRDALNHLYDPDYLRHSTLAGLFGVAKRFDSPSALQRILIAAIEELKPDDKVQSSSHAWRVYDLLFYRYVQQFSQKEVADQLGVSTRHLRREQHDALETLGYALWKQYKLERAVQQNTEVHETQRTSNSPTVNDELAWLKDIPPDSSTDLSEALPAVLSLVRPLASEHRVHLKTELPPTLPELSVHPVALRQILLNLLSVAISRASGGKVVCAVKVSGWQVKIQLTSEAPHANIVIDEGNEATCLELAEKLSTLCGVQLSVPIPDSQQQDKGHRFCAHLTLPARERLPVLALDDNADTLQLLQRYTSGTRYHMISTQDPEELMDMVKKTAPQVIILDVMMPQIDGWEILSRLRQSLRTKQIPVVVCSILVQRDLAFSLGASAFLHKPITRQDFLQALDDLLQAQTRTESH